MKKFILLFMMAVLAGEVSGTFKDRRISMESGPESQGFNR